MIPIQVVTLLEQDIADLQALIKHEMASELEISLATLIKKNVSEHLDHIIKT